MGDLAKVTTERVLEIIFEIIPEDIQKQYEKDVFGNNLTLKDQFISYCEQNQFTSSKYTSEAEVKRMFLYLWSEWNETKNKPSFLSFSLFDDLFL